VLGFGVEAYHGPRTVRALELGVRLKAPVADSAAGFGTGRWDAGADAALTIAAGTGYVFIDAGYWRLGDPPGADLLDPVVFGLGIGRAVGHGGSWSLLASLSGSTEIVVGMGPAVSLGAAAGRRLGDGEHGVSFGAELGLTPAAADLAVHVGWRMRIWSAPRTGTRHAENQ
ncbi:MAG: hypothetical protein ACODAE_10595, partial [Gemmatimonadota bacterium]